MLIDGFSKIVLLRAIVGACVCVFQRPQHCATLRVALSTPRAPPAAEGEAATGVTHLRAHWRGCQAEALRAAGHAELVAQAFELRL